MKEIGGYFELELDKNKEYHAEAIKLNTGRNALEYLLQVRKYVKLFIPYFTCDVILEPIRKLKIEFEFYRVDENFEPIFDFNIIKENEGFFYTNYFGLKDIYVSELSKLCVNLIIDNAQSFFSKQILNVDTFYSPRKFFGVSDGSYLYCDEVLNYNFERDVSITKMDHMLIRLETNASNGYAKFCSNENSLKNMPIKEMSNFTTKILDSIDYDKVILKRQSNFKYLSDQLSEKNNLKLNLSGSEVPLTFPYWTTNKEIKKKLKANKIFCATYWSNVLEWCKPSDTEYLLTKEIIHLPIDQRYGIEDMQRILSILTN